MRLTDDRSSSVVDLLDRADQPPVRAPIETDRRLYLVPLGDVDQDELGLKELPVFYRDKFNLAVEVLRPLALEEQVWDRGRRQVVAEDLVSMMLRRLPELARDPKAVLIGITGEAMYLRSRDWNVVPTHWRYDKAGVVSSVPFRDRSAAVSAQSPVRSRVRKAISRIAGTVLYRLPHGNDPTSVMAQWLSDSHRADLMSDEMDGLGSLAVIDDFVRAHWLPEFTPTVSADDNAGNAPRADGSYPCILARRDRGLRSLDASWQTKIAKCLPGAFTDTAVDEIEIDLRNGSVMTRETDLLVDGTSSLAMTRCYNSWDQRMRTFGYNRGMSWDMYPIGSRNPYTYIDLVLCDARPIYFERISQGVNYADALFEHKHAGSPFTGARFGWTGSGWDLGRTDGTHMFFPESYNAKRGVDGALVGWSGPKGAALVLERDKLRNLRQVSNPEGRGLRFEYDALNRIAKANDGGGRSADYLYDMGGRLVGANTPYSNRSFKYTGTYLESIRENDRTLFTLRYIKGRASELIVGDGQSFKIRYDFDRGNDRRPVRSAVVGPDGKTLSFAIPADAAKRQTSTSQ